MTKTLIKSRYKKKIKISPQPIVTDNKTLPQNLQIFKDKLTKSGNGFLVSINEH